MFFTAKPLYWHPPVVSIFYQRSHIWEKSSPKPTSVLNQLHINKFWLAASLVDQSEFLESHCHKPSFLSCSLIISRFLSGWNPFLMFNGHFLFLSTASFPLRRKHRWLWTMLWDVTAFPCNRFEKDAELSPTVFLPPIHNLHDKLWMDVSKMDTTATMMKISMLLLS